MNLAFVFVADGRTLGFPFQTPTAVSEAVMAAPTNVLRLQLLLLEMESRQWDPCWVADTLEAIAFCMKDPELMLVMQ
jgi:hypothetical protein